MERIRRKMGFVNDIDVSVVGSTGGVSLGWKEGMNVILRGYCDSAFDVMITDVEKGVNWHFTGFYKALERRRRCESWDLLQSFGRGW